MEIHGEEYDTLEDFFREGGFSLPEELIGFAVKATEKYGVPLGAGRHRVVWNTGSGYVIKAPRSEAGSVDNSREYHWYRKREELLGEYAKTKTFDVSGWTLVIAEYLEPLCIEGLKEEFGAQKNWPLWISTVDCLQVGRAKDGSVKAFDFA